MNKEIFINELNRLLPNQFGKQLMIFSLAEKYAQMQKCEQAYVSGQSELLPQLMAKREVLEELMKEKFPLPKKAIAERCNKVGNDIGSIVFKRQ